MTANRAIRSITELRDLIRTCPVIDNHAHNLLRPQGLKTGELLTITTEASGDAIVDAPTSLSHLRAVRILRDLFDLPDTAGWQEILNKRAELLEDTTTTEKLIRKCLQGTQTILVDDGLGSADTLEPYTWHDKFTTSPCKRIVRIETVAADILSSLHQQGRLPVGVALADEEACSLAWVTFITAFEQAIAAAVADPDCVGFKSVVCYRTGLDVEVGRDIDVNEHGLRSFRKHFLPECVARKFRVEFKGMNDALVVSTCKLIAGGYRETDIAKPLQFHTGLGDNDISLLESDPAHLQPLIKAFPTVPIVLLHSSYPYTRQAGYLSTVYKNVFLDIGEVFMMVSRDGQEQIVRQALELTPLSKVVYSTDGHHFPETYYIANVQGRGAIETVLCDYVDKGDLTLSQAEHAVKSIFFENSNKLYDLRLKLHREERASELPILAKEQRETTSENTMAMEKSTKRTSEDTMSNSETYDSRRFTAFANKHPEIEYIFVQWLDYMAQLRSRWIPVLEFERLVQRGGHLNISEGNLGTLQNDHPSPVCDPVGSIGVRPELESLRPMQNFGAVKNAGTVMASFVTDEGEPLPLCPRVGLQKLVQTFVEEYHVHFLVGFEIEVTFCEQTSSQEAREYEPLDTNHAWGTFSDQQYTTAVPLMLSIANALREMGIEILAVHTESGAGQYEFVLPPLPPVHAVDTLLQARQCITQIAATNGLRATCHPQPFPGIGTAAHAHISFNAGSDPAPDLEKIEGSFVAAVLEHMNALCAVTMPQAVSYGRVIDDSWTGGTWVAWGSQNREVPLRKSARLRWEVRCVDGCANMYLALAAILGAGLDGLRKNLELSMKDCRSNPTKLSDAEKAELGITRKLPASLEQAIDALDNDLALQEQTGGGMLAHFLAMKKAEQDMLSQMPEAERRRWLIERY